MQPISTVLRKIGQFFHPPTPIRPNVINGSPLIVIHVHAKVEIPAIGGERYFSHFPGKGGLGQLGGIPTQSFSNIRGDQT